MKQLIEKFKNSSGKIKKWGAAIVTACMSAYPISAAVHSLLHKSDCQQFYGIPRRYFGDGEFEYLILYFVLIVLLVAWIIGAILVSKHLSNTGTWKMVNKIFGMFMVLAVGLTLGLVNLDNFTEVIRSWESSSFFNKWIGGLIVSGIEVVAWTILLSGVVCVVGLVLSDKINDLKWKWVSGVLKGIIIASFTISALLLVWGTMERLDYSIEDKVNYEIARYEGDEYIVLNETDEKILVVKYREEDGRCAFLTYEYFFLDKYSCTYDYVTFNMPPLVIKSRQEGQ